MIEKIRKNVNLKLVFFILILTIFLGIIFFSSSLIVTSDGSWYYWYTGILDGELPFSQWSITRGPTFPIIIWIFKHLFGTNDFGVLIGFFIFYLMIITFAALILHKVLKEYNNKSSNLIYWFLFIVLIALNPLIIGYSHTLLTEAVAPAMILLTTYFAYLWKEVSWIKNKKKSIFYTLIFSLILIFMWFLKQPYAAIIIFIIGISAVLSAIYKKSIKILVEKVIMIFVACIILVISIVGWNEILKHNGVDTEGKNSTNGFLSRGIISGISSYYIEIPSQTFCDINYINNTKLSKNEKEKINKLATSADNWCNRIKLYAVYEQNGSTLKNSVIITDENGLSTLDSLEFLILNTFENPKYTILAYAKNYLSTINLYPVRVTNNNYIATTGPGTVIINENMVNGLATYYDDDRCWWEKPMYRNNPKILNAKDVSYMSNFCSNTKENTFVTNIVKKINPFYLELFKITMLLVAPLSIVMFIMFLKDKNNVKYFITTILFGSSFLHVLFHASLGAIIDRYAYAAFPSAILGIIILLIPKNRSNSLINENLNKDFKKKKVTEKNSIFVIPAYNESKHIEKVIKDIRKNMPSSDIVVTNDYSKDNTKEIVESLGFPCLNVPFNMGYAMAVQTGIKYAYENNYDYVIQFDADGQHLSSEVKKLFKKMKETDANVVIGSRFLEKTGYKHPFFRRVGTKMFSVIIKLFCKKKITDPTSGFQLLDRNVIKRYSQMGKYPEFPDANLIIEMLMEGYKIEEVSVKMKECDDGVSMHGGIIKPIKYMINVTYSIAFILIRGFRRNK